MKTCIKCDQKKEESEYANAHKQYKRNVCRTCKLEQDRNYRKNRNKMIMTPEKKEKGYDTYQNENGVTCIKNFDPYNMGRKGSYIINASTIHASVLPRTSSSDIVKK